MFGVNIKETFKGFGLVLVLQFKNKNYIVLIEIFDKIRLEFKIISFKKCSDVLVLIGILTYIFIIITEKFKDYFKSAPIWILIFVGIF